MNIKYNPWCLWVASKENKTDLFSVKPLVTSLKKYVGSMSVRGEQK